MPRLWRGSLPAGTRRGFSSPEETLRGPCAPEDSRAPRRHSAIHSLLLLPRKGWRSASRRLLHPSPERLRGSPAISSFHPSPLLPPFPTEGIFTRRRIFWFRPRCEEYFVLGRGVFPHGNLIPRWAAEETFCGLSLSRNTFPPPLPPQMVFFFFGVQPQEIFLALAFTNSSDRPCFSGPLKFVFMIFKF